MLALPHPRLLGIVVLVLAIAALVKNLFFR